MFKDRKDAGERLARALEKYKDKNILVLAIPKGGVEVAYQVAKYINAELSILISRKLPFPDNPEAGFGAIAEDGSTFIINGARFWLSEDAINETIKEQKQEINRRIIVLREGRDLSEISGRKVILIDDGVAMGSTMMASIMLCKNRNAREIVIATPVAGVEVAKKIEQLVDKVVILEKPIYFNAVAQVYENWYDVSDEEVIDILDRWHNEQIG
ncbi:phosphoribosyltransferase [candidate division WOR-3 bacterium]|nr:phosphoribosyltransferase [candidate division WOR-3 bacterium]